VATCLRAVLPKLDVTGSNPVTRSGRKSHTEPEKGLPIRRRMVRFLGAESR